MGRRLVWTSLAVAVVSLALFLFRIGTPPAYIYDEGNYVRSARTFLDGTANTNPEHPPLAKIMIAGGMKIAGDNPFGWRIAGAVCGSLTLVAIFLWTYLLLFDYALALTAALLTLFNNFLYVMSRVAMLDVFFFAFVMWGVLAFTAALKLELPLWQRRGLMLASGLMFGLGGACKWTAVVTLAAVVLVAAVFFARNSYRIRELGFSSLVLGLAVVPAVAYGLAYWPLFRELHQPFTLRGLMAMNSFIWIYHVNCPGNPALHVPWYDWFFRATPERGLSYLMGNFVVVWGGLVALVICASRFLRNWASALPEGLVTLLYAINLLQWLVIPQKRTCYYYYYPPAMFLGVALVIALGRMKQPSIAGVRLGMVITIAAAVFFLYCYPRMADLQAPFDCALGCWS